MMRNLIEKIKNIPRPIGIMLAILAYLIFHFIDGSRGLISYFEISATIAQKKQYLEKLQQNNKDLENKVNLMRDGQIDPDILEEQAKSLVNMYGKDEYVLISDKAK